MSDSASGGDGVFFLRIGVSGGGGGGGGGGGSGDGGGGAGAAIPAKHWLQERFEDMAGEGPQLMPGEWRYRNCLDRGYEATVERVASVEFCTSRFGDFDHRIDFEAPVTEAAAVAAAEDYLSQPFDEAYYEKIKHDLFANLGPGPCKTFAEIVEHYGPLRGYLLGDLKYLESIDESKEEPGVFYLSCGS
jgi:hypothetical protein